MRSSRALKVGFSGLLVLLGSHVFAGSNLAQNNNTSGVMTSTQSTIQSSRNMMNMARSSGGSPGHPLPRMTPIERRTLLSFFPWFMAVGIWVVAAWVRLDNLSYEELQTFSWRDGFMNILRATCCSLALLAGALRIADVRIIADGTVVLAVVSFICVVAGILSGHLEPDPLNPLDDRKQWKNFRAGLLLAVTSSTVNVVALLVITH